MCVLNVTAKTFSSSSLSELSGLKLVTSLKTLQSLVHRLTPDHDPTVFAFENTSPIPTAHYAVLKNILFGSRRPMWKLLPH